MKLRIYGASDDLVEVEGLAVGHRPRSEEVDCWERPVEVAIGGRKGIVVVNQHTKHGWETTLRFGPDFEDDDPLPGTITVELSDVGYSLCVEVDCPDETEVVVDGKPGAA